MLSREAPNISFIVFGLTQPEFTPIIYHTRGNHANYNTTDGRKILVCAIQQKILVSQSPSKLNTEITNY
jgi:hypothetical protein